MITIKLRSILFLFLSTLILIEAITIPSRSINNSLSSLSIEGLGVVNNQFRVVYTNSTSLSITKINLIKLVLNNNANERCVVFFFCFLAFSLPFFISPS